MSKAYPSNLTYAQYEFLSELIPGACARWSSPRNRYVGSDQRTFLYLGWGSSMASLTCWLSRMANGIQLLPSMAQRRDMVENSRPSARVDKNWAGTWLQSIGSGHRQSKSQEWGNGALSSGLWCGQENQRTQAIYDGRYLRADPAGLGDSSQCARTRGWQTSAQTG